MAAMRSIETLRVRDAQELLYLLCERLQEHSFGVPETLQLEIRSFAKRLIEDNPDEAITDANSLAARHTEAAPSLFILGASVESWRVLSREFRGRMEYA
jgi:hypothetical protein